MFFASEPLATAGSINWGGIGYTDHYIDKDILSNRRTPLSLEWRIVSEPAYFAQPRERLRTDYLHIISDANISRAVSRISEPDASVD